MDIGSPRVTHLQYFLGLLLAVTIGSIFFWKTIPSSLQQRTSYLTNFAVKSDPIQFSPTTAESKIHLVTVPRLIVQTKKQVKTPIPKPRTIIQVKGEYHNKSPAHSNASVSHLPKVVKHIPIVRDRVYYSKKEAKWDEPVVDWPKAWFRKQEFSHVNQSSTDFTFESEDIVCDMNALTKNLEPTLPPHFELRRFRDLPHRYRSNLDEPIPYPSCGTPGLFSPWKLYNQQNNTDDENENLWMLFIIKSGPGYAENRKRVRDTWGSPENFKKHRIFLLFVIGITNDENLDKNMITENETYGDLLQCDLIDTYHALPIKVLASFRWILERNLKVEFFSLTDDDCLVNLPNVANFLDAEVTTDKDYYKKVYCGFLHSKDAAPLRYAGGKWSVTREQYTGITYPAFCHGGLWILSRPLMHGLYCVAEITDVGDFFLEDVLITGILREKLNFKDTNIKRMVEKKVSPERRLVYHSGGKKDSARLFWREWTIWKRRWEKLKR